MWPSLKLASNHCTALAVVLAAAISAPGANTSGSAAIEAPPVVALKPHRFYYRVAGDFTRDGKALNAPSRMDRLDRALTIMIHQVTAADYRRCVLDHACLPSAPSLASVERPAVKINWHDANTYAVWLSRQLGATYRLPTDEEWAFAAGSRFRDDALPDRVADPAQRWLEQYESEAGRDDGVGDEPRAIGSFGANENGLLDFAGNVWEWTSTCFVHYMLNSGSAGRSIVNCGVRVAEGRHRAYMTDFIRDPRTGGCAVGRPPRNLGFRLVLDRGS